MSRGRLPLLAGLALGASLGLAGCGARHDGAAANDPAAALRAHYGSCASPQAELHLRVRPAEGESLSFTVAIDASPQRTVLKAYKQGAAIFDGV
ncbi:MAG: hypothetical protein ACYTF0_04505, partial [Planctomycetota bacterium]